jgi:hypothetical protein
MAAPGFVTPNEATVWRMWQAHQENRIDDMLQEMHPGVQWRPFSRPGQNRYMGHDGIRKMVRDVRTANGPYSIIPDRILEIGEDAVSAWTTVLIHQPPQDHRTEIEFRITLSDGLVYFVEALASRTDT